MAGLWHHFIQRRSAVPESIVLQALARAGLVTHPLSAGHQPAEGMGVVFFDDLDQNLCHFIRDISQSGLKRVLAIASSRTAFSSDHIWNLLQHGASDVFAWDHSNNSAAEVAARFERWQTVDQLVESPLVRDNLVGKSPAWITVLRQVVEVAKFTEAPILISGESGTGKELVARLIHTLDPRAQKRELIVLDCTTVVPELSGSEFFGHERGAFTGAMAAREGAFALANGGTLFLDEVGELAGGLQAELLRVVQEHTYKRVGSNIWQQTDFRLVCATNKDLRQEELQGKFRRDFYYRIASWTCKLPPLRERMQDILPLAFHFFHQLRSHEEAPGMDGPVCEHLLKRDYPGNVRDLRQAVARMSYRHVGRGPITVGDIPEEERPQVGSAAGGWRNDAFEGAVRQAVALGVGLKEITQAASDAAYRITIDEENGNLLRAARRLGVSRRWLEMRRATERRHANETPTQ